MLIKGQADLDVFKKMYGIDGEIVESYRFGIYTAAFLLGYYVFSQDIVIEVLKKWRFVSTLAAVVSGVYFIYRAYGIYYGHSSLLSTWYANLFRIVIVTPVSSRQFLLCGYLLCIPEQIRNPEPFPMSPDNHEFRQTNAPFFLM